MARLYEQCLAPKAYYLKSCMPISRSIASWQAFILSVHCRQNSSGPNAASDFKNKKPVDQLAVAFQEMAAKEK